MARSLELQWGSECLFRHLQLHGWPVQFQQLCWGTRRAAGVTVYPNPAGSMVRIEAEMTGETPVTVT